MKTNLLKTFLLAAMMVVSGQAWGDSKVTFYSNDFSSSSSLDLIST